MSRKTSFRTAAPPAPQQSAQAPRDAAPVSSAAASVSSAAAPLAPKPAARPFPGSALAQALFGIDLRSLAFFRIALALSLLADLFMRCVDIEAFYTDGGILPRGAALQSQWGFSHYFSFHALTGTAQGEGFLFGVNAVFLMLLLAGWNTRAMTVVCWVFLISLQSRNPLVLQGGDVLLRCLTFWAIFLPLGSYLSLDAQKQRLPRLPGDPAHPVLAFSWGTVAALLQVVFVYWFTALLKTDASWWNTGYAVHLALSVDMLTKPLGRYIVQFPIVTYLLTYATVLIEGFGPFGAFVPFKNGPVRTATVFLFWFFHLIALQSMMYLGPFPWTCSLGWILFLPPWFWDTLAARWVRLLPAGARTKLAAWAARHLPRVAPDAPADTLRLPLWANLAAGFYLTVVTVWNVRSVYLGAVLPYFPFSWNAVAEVPHLDQSWDMFSPKPTTDAGWYVIAGHLRDGSTVDLMPYLGEYGDNTPLTDAKPAEIGTQFRDERWRKYFLNIWPNNNARFRRYLADYLTRRWNREHHGGRDLCWFEIIYMKMDTPDHYLAIPKAAPFVIYRHWCYPEFAPKGEAATSMMPLSAPGKAAAPQHP